MGKYHDGFHQLVFVVFLSMTKLMRKNIRKTKKEVENRVFTTTMVLVCNLNLDDLMCERNNFQSNNSIS